MKKESDPGFQVTNKKSFKNEIHIQKKALLLDREKNKKQEANKHKKSKRTNINITNIMEKV